MSAEREPGSILRGLHVLDGAMATELEARGANIDGPLWSAHMLEAAPEKVAAVHRACRSGPLNELQLGDSIPPRNKAVGLGGDG